MLTLSTTLLAFPIIMFFSLFIQIGIRVAFVFVCKAICNSRGLPDSYMWFGLLGVIGIIIVAVVSPPAPPFNYYQQQQQYYNQNPNSDVKFCTNCGAPNNKNSLNCYCCGNHFS